METNLNELTVNGVTYVQKSSIEQKATDLNGMPYVIARTYSAGVHAGYLESRNGKEAVIRKSRRIWYWEGAASLSQLAMSGTSKPENCKFPEEIDKHELMETIEIIHCTEKGRISIQGVRIWKQ